MAANCQVLCAGTGSCHEWKTRGEAPVRALGKRWQRRLAILTRRPSPAHAVFGALFIAGLATSRWLVFCLLALAFLWFAPPIWRSKRPWWTGRSMGGGGFNRQPDFDRILEERQGGIAGRISRRYWWWRRLFFSWRYIPMTAMLTYLAGVYVRHLGDDTALLVLRGLL